MNRIRDGDELAEHRSRRVEEIRLLKTKPARKHRLLAFQLKFYHRALPSTINEIPETPLHCLADQLDAEVSGFQDYEWSG